jgi:methylated-DNA-[protein]-cysteine S-methyltransferase
MESIMAVHFTMFKTALGPCAVAWAERGIVAVQLPQPDEAQTRVRLKQRYADCRESVPPSSVLATIERITALMEGEAVDLSQVELDLTAVPEFNRNVYAIARQIPAGKTLTYGDIARQLGGVALSRDVGRAMGQNPCPVIVPCHRVLAAGGKPGGFSANGGVETKLKMLAIEGAYVNHTPSLFD